MSGDVGDINIPNYRVKKNGRGYWEPTRTMREAGFQPIACGVDGPLAWAKASKADDAWQDYRRGIVPEAEIKHIPGSIGEAWHRYAKTREFKTKATATQDEWWRAWKYIGGVFADVDPVTVTLEDISDLRAGIEEDVSLSEAHRVIKIWRAGWVTWSAMGYCQAEADPSKGVRNKAPKGRRDTWLNIEVWLQIRRAWREGYTGLALGLSIMRDSGCSPIDAREALASQIVTNGRTTFFAIDRAKTGKPAYVPLSSVSLWLLAAMEREVGAAFIGQARIVRQRSGDPYNWRSKFNEDHRVIRTLVFGEQEKRQLKDIRRTATVEAIDGDVTKEHLSNAMGNTIGYSNQLWQTYNKPSPVSGLAFQEARRRGRKKGTNKG